MITLGKLTEQIFRLYNSGNPSADSQVTKQEINVLVGQSVNKLLKVEHMGVNIKSYNDMFPPHTMISTYTITNTGSGQSGNLDTYETSKSRALLPVHPISLPRNMGVWSVSPIGDGDQQYIPIQSGQYSLVNSQDVLQYLDNQVGYYVDGRYIIFTKDITASPFNVTSLKVRLLVVDATVLGPYDYVPLPADMEDMVIKDVLKTLSVMPEKEDVVIDNNKQA